MTRQIEIEIEKLLSIMPMGLIFTTKWFKDTLHGLYGRPRDSYIPSDYCHNIKNNGINWETQPHYFKALEHGEYRYVGENYCNGDKHEDFNRILDLKFDDNILGDFFNETNTIALLKQEFKNYLIQKYPNVSKVTIDTYLRDSFYVYRHNHEFSIDFFDLFKDKQNIENFSNEIISQQTNIKRIKKPKASAKAYINGLNRLYDFFNEKYGGVENFISS